MLIAEWAPGGGDPPQANARAQALRGENIVCFAKDWGADPTSVTHVMRRLAQQNRVIWVNSVGARAPAAGSPSDLRRLIRKAVQCARPVRHVERGIWTVSLPVIPSPRCRAAVTLNRAIASAFLGSIRSALGMREFQLWVWPPAAALYAEGLGQALTVYYCTDSWPHFRGVDAARMAEWDARITRAADVVFATSRSLYEEKLELNRETHVAPHGVDHALFARALDPATPVPQDLLGRAGPVLGFYGLIEDWMDQSLIARLAARHPEWTIAIIGPARVDVSAIARFPNVLLLGRRQHVDLPAYCKRFSVGLLPHRVNELTRHMNPIKLREYLSAGLPVVSTPLPECRAYEGLCTVAASAEEYESAVALAIADDSPDRRRARSEAMAGETWEARVEEISARVAAVQSARRERAAGRGQRPTDHRAAL